MSSRILLSIFILVLDTLKCKEGYIPTSKKILDQNGDWNGIEWYCGACETGTWDNNKYCDPC